MRHRKGVVVLIVLLVLFLGVFLWWRSPSSRSAKKDLVAHLTPSIGVASMNITDIDKDKIKIKTKVSLKNPLPADIHSHGMSYEIYIDSQKVIQDDYTKPINIKSKDSTTIEMPMEILAKPMKEVLEYFDKNKVDSAEYRIRAVINVDVPVAGQKTIPLTVSKRLPAIRIPQIKVQNVDLHLLHMKKKGCDMQVRVTNPNVFPIKMKDAVFSFGIGNGDMEMDGKLQHVVDIPAKGSQDVSMHANLTKGKMLKTGWDFVAKQNTTPYTYKMNFKIISDNASLNDSKMAMNMNGTVGELMNAMKEMKE